MCILSYAKILYSLILLRELHFLILGVVISIFCNNSLIFCNNSIIQDGFGFKNQFSHQEPCSTIGTFWCFQQRHPGVKSLLPHYHYQVIKKFIKKKKITRLISLCLFWTSVVGTTTNITMS